MKKCVFYPKMRHFCTIKKDKKSMVIFRFSTLKLAKNMFGPARRFQFILYLCYQIECH